MKKMPPIFLKHLNGNLLCVVDVETTGRVAGFHEVIQVGVLPINYNFEPINVTPFSCNIRAEYLDRIDPRALRVNRINIVEHNKRALDSLVAADLFDQWFHEIKQKFNMKLEKKLSPLAQNWPFTKSMVERWLGYKLVETDEEYRRQTPSMDRYFTEYYRDLKPLIQFVNDRADHSATVYPFPKYTLESICMRLGVHRIKSGNAIGDCIDIATCYRQLLNLHATSVEVFV